MRNINIKYYYCYYYYYYYYKTAVCIKGKSVKHWYLFASVNSAFPFIRFRSLFLTRTMSEKRNTCTIKHVRPTCFDLKTAQRAQISFWGNSPSEVIIKN